MAKAKTSVYFCQNCGFESSKWMGQGPGCKEWNTFVEEVIEKSKATASIKKAAEEEFTGYTEFPKSVDMNRTAHIGKHTHTRAHAHTRTHTAWPLPSLASFQLH